MRMESVDNPAWHSTYDGEWARWDEVQAALDDEHLSLQAASEFIRDVSEALHGVRPGQEDIVNLIELAKVVKERIAPETTDAQDAERYRFLKNKIASAGPIAYYHLPRALRFLREHTIGSFDGAVDAARGADVQYVEK